MIPKIVIVGRPNVGKSSLLNFLAKRKVSIVDDMAGVTRDRVSITVQLPGQSSDKQGKYAQIIDTGGYGIKDSQNLTAQIEEQIAQGLAQADIVLFITDAKTGIVALDKTVAAVLRESNLKEKTIIPVANKADSPADEPNGYEMMQLGFGEPVMISATNGHNKDNFFKRINEQVNKLIKISQNSANENSTTNSAPPTGLLVAIVGKRNAGKSTLVNALAGEERVIVSEQKGTTRDSVDVTFEFDNKTYTAIDTAGVRKRKSIKESVEFYSHHRSLRSVRRAQVCLFLIDASLPISQVDRQLSKEILDHFRPVVLVVNKWDLAENEHTQEEYGEYLSEELKGLNFAPIVFTSATNSEGLKEALDMAGEMYEQASTNVSTASINKVIEQITSQRGPSSPGGKRAKIYYATQTDTNPPSIMIFVNDPDLFDANYQRYLINQFRDMLPFAEVPIKLTIRPRRSMSDK